MVPKIKPVCCLFEDESIHDNTSSCLEMIKHLDRFTLSSRKAALKRDLDVHTELNALREEIKQLREASKGRS